MSDVGTKTLLIALLADNFALMEFTLDTGLTDGMTTTDQNSWEMTLFTWKGIPTLPTIHWFEFITGIV